MLGGDDIMFRRSNACDPSMTCKYIIHVCSAVARFNNAPDIILDPTPLRSALRHSAF